MRFTLFLPTLAVLLALPADAQERSFERDVRPILKAHCFLCHGEDGKPKGGVDLRLRRFMLKELDEGVRVMVPGQPEESEMLRLVRAGEMPKKGKKLTAAEIATLEQWIAQGAKTLREEPEQVPKFWITEEERAFWAFQAIARPAVPERAGAKNAVDAFVLAKLEAGGLSFAPEAEKQTLLRRVTLDLTGLPPSPEAVAAFVADASPEAYEKVVDRLLASPAYGERWARHWLDVAGYADSNGFAEADSLRPHAWRYRDYVIRAMNADKPWDRFIQEQLAGDELAGARHGDADAGIRSPEATELLTATGFLRNAPDGTGDQVPDQNLARNQVVVETIKIVSSSLLGLTVGCAQCHDHRYDPIAQEDYTRLRAVFEPAFDWKQWRAPAARLVSLFTPEQRAQSEAIEGEARERDAAADALNAKFKDEIFAKRLGELPEELREPIRAVRATAAEKRTPEQRQLFKDHPALNVDAGPLDLFDKEADAKVKAVRAEAAKHRARKPPEPMLPVLTEVAGQVPETFLFHRGDHDQPREKVAPGELAILALSSPASIPEKDPALATSGRRLAYARHLTDGKHPLVARVLVNRFWQHHFGRGLVNTTGDFGALGERPTHPELLDWLASEFMAGGWRLKPLQKLMVMSAAYRQSSRHDAALAADPDNRLYARFRLQRLDAETLRDAILAATGKLDPEAFGEPTPVARHITGRIVVGDEKLDANSEPVEVLSRGAKDFRRSIYIQARRKYPLTVLDTFDAPIMSPNCNGRTATTIAPQALMLMNDQFVVDQSLALAQRLRAEGGDHRARVARLWRLLFNTDPTDAEAADALAFWDAQSATLTAKGNPDPSLAAAASLCQVLLASNRFLYIE